MNTVNLMWLSFIGYIILQLYAVVRWTGAWRKHALFSLILMSLITVYTIYGLIMKSNLWPLLLLFASRSFLVGIYFALKIR